MQDATPYPPTCQDAFASTIGSDQCMNLFFAKREVQEGDRILTSTLTLDGH